MAYYLRQKGFTKEYKQIWEKMTAFSYSNSIEKYEQIGIYHDNPTITPLNECDYVACIVPSNQENLFYDSSLPMLEIQECICITFEVEASHFEVLKIIQWVYHEWLPNSGYEKITIPSYMIYENCDLINPTSKAKGVLHIPVRYM